MVEIGYKLSSEEHSPSALVRHARRAEEVGFTFAAISDHYHPWIHLQGHSPFVWSVIGGIAATTTRLRVGTAVTCPTLRLHPAIVAQAAATAAALLPGRFFLGVGTGENLNEHILGDQWPPAPKRRAMLAEAVQIIRRLWTGDPQTYDGRYYTVESAQLHTLPAQPPPILVAAAGPIGAQLAAEIGDGLVSVAPAASIVRAFDEAGGAGKPRYAEVSVCWAETEDEALRTAREWWPIAGLAGPLLPELRTPANFQQAAATMREEAIAASVAAGPAPERHLARLREYIAAGYDHLFVHQIGPDQEGFFRFYEREVLPQFR